jgi:hypothetical protein
MKQADDKERGHTYNDSREIEVHTAKLLLLNNTVRAWFRTRL